MEVTLRAWRSKPRGLICRLQQDTAFKQWRKSSQRRQWMRRLRAHRSTLLGAATALAAFMLVVVTISLTRLTHEPAGSMTGAPAGVMDTPPSAHAETMQARLRQVQNELGAVTLRAETAERDQHQQQLATDRQLKLWEDQTAAEASREAAARHDAAVQAKQVASLQRQLHASLQSASGPGQLSDSGALKQTQEQLEEAQRRLTDAESRAVDSEAFARAAQREVMTYKLASAASGANISRTGTHWKPVAPPAWALQHIADFSRHSIKRMQTLPLWWLASEIAGAAALLYGLLRLVLWLLQSLAELRSTQVIVTAV